MGFDELSSSRWWFAKEGARSQGSVAGEQETAGASQGKQQPAANSVWAAARCGLSQLTSLSISSSSVPRLLLPLCDNKGRHVLGFCCARCRGDSSGLTHRDSLRLHTVLDDKDLRALRTISFNV